MAVLSPERWLLWQQPYKPVLAVTQLGRNSSPQRTPAPLLYLGELFGVGLLSISEVIQLYLAAET